MGAGASGEEALDAGMWGVGESALNTAATAATDPAGEQAGETDAAEAVGGGGGGGDG